MRKSSLEPSKRLGLLDEIDRTRFIARRVPQWGEQAAGLLWKRQQDLRLVAVVVSVTLIIAVLSASGLVIGITIASGGVVSLLLALRIHSLRKRTQDVGR